jgi:tetratricopeptide (TPR) repeat protein
MKTRIIANYIIGICACCLALLLFSSCSLFHRSSSDFSLNLTQQQLQKFVQSIRPYEGDAKYHYSFASYLQKRGKHRLAIQEFRKAIRIDPIYAVAYNGLGVSYDALGKYPRAVQAYRTALALKPGLGYALNNLGYSYILQGNIDSAIKVLKRAVALNRNNRQYHNNLALAYSKKGLCDAAFNEFKAAEGEAKAHFNVAQIYYEHREYKKARKHYEKSLMGDPDSRRAREGWEASKALAKIMPSEPRSERKPAVSANEKASQQPEVESHTVPVAMSRPAIERIQTRQKVENAEDLYPLRASEIEISNGNGVRHMAQKVGSYLTSRGFSRSFLTNADNFNHAKTMIYYRRGYLQKAYRVAQEIPGYQNMEATETFSHPQTNIKVVIGKDLIPCISILSAG